MPNEAQIDYILKELDFAPTSEQEPVLHDPSRVVLVAGGERSGKSDTSAKKLLTRLAEGKLFWLVAADYSGTRAEYDYICDGLDKLHWAYTASKNIDPGEIVTLDDVHIITKSAMLTRKLGVQAPDGILACEAGQLTYEDFLRLRGRIAEKRGWLHMSGTFESSLGWYPENWQRWQLPNADGARSYSLPSWSNTAIYPGGRTDPEIKALEAGCSKEWFSERYGGVPVPPKGRVFIEFSNTIHVGVGGLFEFDPALDVYIFCDPGYAAASVILATQKRSEHLYIVDEIYETGFVTSDMIAIAKQKPWFNKVIGGAIDIAALQHQAQPAVAEVWLREARIHLRSQKIKIQDGVEAVKRFLGVNPITNSPLLHINTRCRGLISEMGGCASPLDGQTRVYTWRMDREGNVVGDVPDDKNNHACKALAYGIIDLFGYSSAQRRQPITKFFK